MGHKVSTFALSDEENGADDDCLRIHASDQRRRSRQRSPECRDRFPAHHRRYQARAAALAVLLVAGAPPRTSEVMAAVPRFTVRRQRRRARCGSSGAFVLLASPKSSSSSSSIVPPPGSRMARLQELTDTAVASPSSPASPPSPSLPSPPSPPRGNENGSGGGGGKGRQSAGMEAQWTQFRARRGTGLRYAASDGAPASWISAYDRGQQPRRRSRRRLFPDESSLRAGEAPSPEPPSSSESDAERDYQRRKAAWAAKYASASALRRTFGSNRNRLWGDFGPSTTRRLYHILLPRALLGLHDMGRDMGVEHRLDELAPLAYEARKAAKNYARERSTLPGRLASRAYDGFRTWRRYGKFDAGGMSWEQVWTKYEDQVLDEVMEECSLDAVDGVDGGREAVCEGAAEFRRSRERQRQSRGPSSPSIGGEKDRQWYATFADLDDEELTARICLRILERSVVTNEAIDRLFRNTLGELEVGDNRGSDDDDDSESAEKLSADGEEERRKRNRRKRVRRLRREFRIRADLRAIGNQFDRDIREVLLRGEGGEGGATADDAGVKPRVEGGAGRGETRAAVVAESHPPTLETSSLWAQPDSTLSSSHPSGGANEDRRSRRGSEGEADADSDGDARASAFPPGLGGDDTTKEAQPHVAPSSEAQEVAADMLSITEIVSGLFPNDDATVNRRRTLAAYEVFALRILVVTKRRIADLRRDDEDGNEDGGGALAQSAKAGAPPGETATVSSSPPVA